MPVVMEGKKKRRLLPEDIRRRFRRLAKELGRAEWILQGTIRPRRIPARRAGTASVRLYGPYYQWTFKDAGKTVTVNLSAAQNRACQQAIRRQRRIETMLAQMRALSRQYLESTIQGVVRRKHKD